MSKYTYTSVLAIAGFDGSGGAGQQADLKTISALGCYATCVLTSLPIQNTTGVKNIYPIPLQAVSEQIDAVLSDIPPAAIKIGMVHSADLAQLIATKLRQFPQIPVVFDPVMVAASGDKLIQDADIQVIVQELFPLATIITPNMDEAGVLADMEVKTSAQMLQAGERIAQIHPHSILLKGGHQNTEQLHSYLRSPDGALQEFVNPRIATRNTHGAGCTLSSAIASYLALGHELSSAVSLAQDYVYNAILHSSDVQIGHGTGPLNHFFAPRILQKNS